MYADEIANSMREAMDETDRRRASRSPTTPTRARSNPLRKKIADILDQVYREADDAEAIDIGGSGRNSSRGRRAQGEPRRR